MSSSRDRDRDRDRVARTARILTLFLAISALPLAVSPDGGAAEPRVRWDLTPIYADDAAWKEALEGLAKRKSALERYKGRLGESAELLEKALDEVYDLSREAGRLDAYSNLRSDEDTRQSGPQGMKLAFQALVADLNAALAWVDPELLSIPRERLQGFLDQNAGLEKYRRHMERLEKLRAHVLDAESERILGKARLIRGEGVFIGNLLRNAEIPWPSISLRDGSTLRVDVQGYTRARASQNRGERVKAYGAFYGTLKQFQESLAATVGATVKEHVFEASIRSYDSSLEASLASNEVDPTVYEMLVREVNAALPTLHRYLKLRGRMLGIEDLRYHDMYPALVKTVEAEYDWDASRSLVASALAPLGEEYVQRLQSALESGWVDVYPRPGKRAGAYVNDSAHGVHPYMLLNHLDDYHSASTLAHEGGHLMHSWYSQESQPYPTAGYSIFVAEVASTVNEVLLFHHMLERTNDDDARLILLGNFLEVFRQTVFRQTMFAEFERSIHEAAERGEPLTGDALDELYGGLLRRYHGHDLGIVKIDDLYAVEWALVPHFHYNFYVYQYATSYVAAVALGERIHQRQPGAAERHLGFLKAGSSNPPVELLKDAGVDMTSPEPIRAAVRAMDRVLDRIEKILAQRRERQV